MTAAPGSPARFPPRGRGPVLRATPRSWDSWSGRTIPRSERRWFASSAPDVSRECASRGPGGHLRAGPHAVPGAARGNGAGRPFTNQNEIDGALVRHPPEVVLLARGTGGPNGQARA